MTGFRLTRLELTGDRVSPAALDFGPGLNVITGASDTGKSYLVEVIDFMLGGSTPPRQIPESTSYNRAHLTITTTAGQTFALSRALQGGDFTLVDPGDPTKPPVLLADKLSQHNENNISTFLLGLSGLLNKRVRINSDNGLANLSFRDLAHLSIIDEQRIIGRGSPIHSGENTAKTREYSILKLLLTGSDDSALIAMKKKAIAKSELEAQIQLIDQLIEDDVKDLRERANDPDGLPGQIEMLMKSISESEQRLNNQRQAFESQEQSRKDAWKNRDRIQSRIANIDGLLERFDLLNDHYATDLKRLQSLAEAGTQFADLPQSTCPLCGATPANHSHEQASPDINIASIRTACEREASKIEKLQKDLRRTILEIKAERKTLLVNESETESAFQSANAHLRDHLMPLLSAARKEHTTLLEKKSEVQANLVLKNRIDSFRVRRAETMAALSATSKRQTERPQMPAGSYSRLVNSIESLLDAWHFPHGKPIIYDEIKSDLTLGNRRRGEQGKGLRALTHAAFIIGLHESCILASLPIPGFVLLDSPLVTFREASSIEAGLDRQQQLDIKQAFYRDLITRCTRVQIVVVENEDPHSELMAQMTAHFFTGLHDQGRFGFFPPQGADGTIAPPAQGPISPKEEIPFPTT